MVAIGAICVCVRTWDACVGMLLLFVWLLFVAWGKAVHRFAVSADAVREREFSREETTVACRGVLHLVSAMLCSSQVCCCAVKLVLVHTVGIALPIHSL